MSKSQQVLNDLNLTNINDARLFPHKIIKSINDYKELITEGLRPQKLLEIALCGSYSCPNATMLELVDLAIENGADLNSIEWITNDFTSKEYEVLIERGLLPMRHLNRWANQIEKFPEIYVKNFQALNIMVDLIKDPKSFDGTELWITILNRLDFLSGDLINPHISRLFEVASRFTFDINKAFSIVMYHQDSFTSDEGVETSLMLSIEKIQYLNGLQTIDPRLIFNYGKYRKMPQVVELAISLGAEEEVVVEIQGVPYSDSTPFTGPKK